MIPSNILINITSVLELVEFVVAALDVLEAILDFRFGLVGVVKRTEVSPFSRISIIICWSILFASS